MLLQSKKWWKSNNLAESVNMKGFSHHQAYLICSKRWKHLAISRYMKGNGEGAAPTTVHSLVSCVTFGGGKSPKLSELHKGQRNSSFMLSS